MPMFNEFHSGRVLKYKPCGMMRNVNHCFMQYIAQTEKSNNNDIIMILRRQSDWCTHYSFPGHFNSIRQQPLNVVPR